MATSGAIAPTLGLRRLLAEPITVGARRLPPIGLVLAATVGAVLLAVVARSSWAVPADEHAYWLAGQRLLHNEPLYDLSATSITPYAYWYPPMVAQIMAPISAVLPADAFSWAWIAMLLGCLLWLANGRPLVFLAMIAFLPVATELGFRNVHLVLAVLIVLAIERWPAMYAAGAAVKLSPGLGVAYLAARGRWRDAAIVVLAGLAIVAVSVALAPSAWAQFIDILRSRGPSDASSFVNVPYWIRAVGGLGLAVVAGRLPPRYGEPLLVVAIVLALPTLWFTALSVLVALVLVTRLRPLDRSLGSTPPAAGSGSTAEGT